jgi:hypothetical protein
MLGHPSWRRQRPLSPHACLFKETPFSSVVSVPSPSSIGASAASSSLCSPPSPARASNVVSTSHPSYTAQELSRSRRSHSGAAAPAVAAAELRRAGMPAAPQPETSPEIEPRGPTARPPPAPGRSLLTSSPDSGEDHHRLPLRTKLRATRSFQGPWCKSRAFL